MEVKSTILNKIGTNAFCGDKKLGKIILKTTQLTKKSIGKNALKGTNLIRFLRRSLLYRQSQSLI